jgi:hypothetical protein
VIRRGLEAAFAISVKDRDRDEAEAQKLQGVATTHKGHQSITPGVPYFVQPDLRYDIEVISREIAGGGRQGVANCF